MNSQSLLFTPHMHSSEIGVGTTFTASGCIMFLLLRHCGTERNMIHHGRAEAGPYSNCLVGRGGSNDL